MRGRTANDLWERTLQVLATAPGQGPAAICARWAREEVDALDRFSGVPWFEEEIERLGLDFGISTRLTSSLAISEEPTVDPAQTPRRIKLPQVLPYGLSADGLGLWNAQNLALAGTLLDSVRGAPLRAAKLLELRGKVRSVEKIRRVAGGSRGAPSRIFARVVSRDKRRLQLEVTLRKGSVWTPEEWKSLRLEDGNKIPCRVVSSDVGRQSLRVLVEAERDIEPSPMALVSENGTEIPLQ